MLHVTIGEVSRRTNLKIPTIRFYEEIGLLPAPKRAANGRRAYTETDIGHLTFIHNARHLGFSLDQIRALLDLAAQPASRCEEAQALAESNLAAVKARIKSLRALERELTLLASCEGKSTRNCRIIEALLTARVV